MTATISVEDVVWRLAALASLPYQERYVVNGNASEYVRDDELIMDVDALAFRVFRPENRDVLTATQSETLEVLLSTIKATPLGDDIVHDPGWQKIREAAGRATESFGIRVEDLTPKYVCALSD